MQPIKPQEVKARLISSLPPEVINVFNNLIQKNFNGTEARVLQKDAVKGICEALAISKNQAFENKLLDVEDAFREAGWIVSYDKPAYCETYDAYFIFKKPQEKSLPAKHY